MAFDDHKNFAVSTIQTAPSPATSGTSLVISTGDGTKFPTVPFNATVWPQNSNPTSSNAEIVRVTAIATDTFTIQRTQESTSARTIVAGDNLAATVTDKTLTDIEAGTNFTALGSATLDVTGATTLATGSASSVTIGGGATASELRLKEPSGSGANYTAFKAQAQSADITYTLPAADGTSGYVLTTNGSGSLSWAVGGTSVDDATNILANQVFS